MLQNIQLLKWFNSRAVVVGQFVKWSLSIPEVRSSNPVIGKIYIEYLFTLNCIQKTNIKKKGPGMAHSKNGLSETLKVFQFWLKAFQN